MTTTLEIQTRLKELGCNPGPLDGAMGRNTTAAIKTFQTGKGLVADGIVGAKTARALGLPTEKPRPQSTKDEHGGGMALPWYEEARRWIGLQETHGPKTDPNIADWLEELSATWDDDETPWCGTFVGHCITATLPDEPIPANPFGAVNWKKFGKEVRPQIGCVLVFWRESKTSGKGHVGFMAGEDRTHYHVLGGNQSDSVSVARVPKERFIAARWPSTAPFLATGSGEASGVAGEGRET